MTKITTKKITREIQVETLDTNKVQITLDAFGFALLFETLNRLDDIISKPIHEKQVIINSALNFSIENNKSVNDYTEAMRFNAELFAALAASAEIVCPLSDCLRMHIERD